MSAALTSTRQHPSYGDCLEVKREYYQNCSVLGCVTQCSQSAAHSYEQFLQVSRLGLSHWDPYAMHRGGCLELYYCNMVEWSWWDSGLIWKTNWLPSVLWHCWFGHMTCKIVPEMTYNVSSGRLSLCTTTTKPCQLIYLLSLFSIFAFRWARLKLYAFSLTSPTGLSLHIPFI